MNDTTKLLNELIKAAEDQVKKLEADIVHLQHFTPPQVAALRSLQEMYRSNIHHLQSTAKLFA